MKTLKPKPYFNKTHLSVFLIVFAVLGLIILIKSLAAPNPNLPGDLNNDNTVNITDLSILLTNYGTSNSSADINGDGAVNVLDLSILLSNYGKTYSGGGGAAVGSWLAASSPFNTLIPSSPVVTANYGSSLVSGVSGIGFNTSTWGVGLFEQPSSTTLTNLTQPSWACGSNPCWKFDNVPLPPQWFTYETTQLSLGDGERHSSILVGDKIYSLYEATQDSAGWHFVGGGELRYGGSGVWNNNLGPWVGRASGFSDYAGAVRKAEVDAGAVNHALVGAWPAARISSNVISPADTSQNTCSTSVCIPMGSRLQLNPALTTTDFANMGINSYWWPILVAMQKYGIYIGDGVGSNNLNIYAEVWNNNGRVNWTAPKSSGWDDVSYKLMPYFRIVQAPPAPVLDDRTIFGQPHQ